jgi:hypothetical protein
MSANDRTGIGYEILFNRPFMFSSRRGHWQ